MLDCNEFGCGRRRRVPNLALADLVLPYLLRGENLGAQHAALSALRVVRWETASDDFGIAMVAGVLLVYCVLVLRFHDFAQPLTIMAALPLSMSATQRSSAQRVGLCERP